MKTSVGGTISSFLIDSGASVSIIGQTIYRGLKKSRTPQLQSVDMTLTTATGDIIPVLGKAVFPFNIEGVVYEQEAIVADLKGLTGVLGVDFLVKYNGVMNFKEKSLKLGQKTIQLSPEENVVTNAHIRISNTVSVPENSVSYFKGYIDGSFSQEI